MIFYCENLNEIITIVDEFNGFTIHRRFPTRYGLFINDWVFVGWI